MAAITALLQLSLCCKQSQVCHDGYNCRSKSAGFMIRRESTLSARSYLIPLCRDLKHPRNRLRTVKVSSITAAQAALDALIFDCDGVILESEDLHRTAYNATFENFNVQCPGKFQPVDWTTEFYDVLQNTIGGGKPKMRWYFNENGWPTSTLSSEAPQTDEAKAYLIDRLQDWKTAKYKEMIASGSVPPRPGVLRLMDEARSQGLKVAVCSAATKSSVVFVLTNLIGQTRYEELDCFLAGDDVDKKKPDPTIYQVAAERLGVDPGRCLVVEDSSIGLRAAVGAGMRCVVTYTSSTQSQGFEGAEAVFPDLSTVSLKQLRALLEPVTS